jgi:hypothetical protein
MVKTFPPHRSLEQFAQRVGVRCFNRGFEDIGPGTNSRTGEFDVIFTIGITNKVLGAYAERGRLAELLGGLAIGRVHSHPKVNDAARG